AIDPTRATDETTPIGWVLSRLRALEEVDRADDTPVELERGGARVVIRIDRWKPEPVSQPEPAMSDADVQLTLFEPGGDGAAAPSLVPALAPLPPVPEPPLHRVRRLSFTALGQFESCSYRYYAERIVGMKATDERLAAPGT